MFSPGNVMLSISAGRLLPSLKQSALKTAVFKALICFAKEKDDRERRSSLLKVRFGIRLECSQT